MQSFVYATPTTNINDRMGMLPQGDVVVVIESGVVSGLPRSYPMSRVLCRHGVGYVYDMILAQEKDT